MCVYAVYVRRNILFLCGISVLISACVYMCVCASSSDESDGDDDGKNSDDERGSNNDDEDDGGGDSDDDDNNNSRKKKARAPPLSIHDVTIGMVIAIKGNKEAQAKMSKTEKRLKQTDILAGSVLRVDVPK